MQIIFDATRKQVKPASLFGAGILPARSTRRDITDADRQWAAYELNAGCTDYDVVEPARDWDGEAGAALATVRMEAGMTGTF